MRIFEKEVTLNDAERLSRVCLAYSNAHRRALGLGELSVLPEFCSPVQFIKDCLGAGTVLAGGLKICYEHEDDARVVSRAWYNAAVFEDGNVVPLPRDFGELISSLKEE